MLFTCFLVEMSIRIYVQKVKNIEPFAKNIEPFAKYIEPFAKYIDSFAEREDQFSESVKKIGDCKYFCIKSDGCLNLCRTGIF